MQDLFLPFYFSRQSETLGSSSGPSGTPYPAATSCPSSGLFTWGTICLNGLWLLANPPPSWPKPVRLGATFYPFYASQNSDRSFRFNGLRMRHLSFSAGFYLPKALLVQPLQRSPDSLRNATIVS